MVKDDAHHDGQLKLGGCSFQAGTKPEDLLSHEGSTFFLTTCRYSTETVYCFWSF